MGGGEIHKTVNDGHPPLDHLLPVFGLEVLIACIDCTIVDLVEEDLLPKRELYFDDVLNFIWQFCLHFLLHSTK